MSEPVSAVASAVDAVAHALDVPDDVDRARAILHVTGRLRHARRKLAGRLSPASAVVWQTTEAGCVEALRALGAMVP